MYNMLLCSSHEPIRPQPYPVIYVVANPVRGLLDRKRSEEYLLQSSNESMKQKQKNKTKQKMTKKNTTGGCSAGLV